LGEIPLFQEKMPTDHILHYDSLQFIPNTSSNVKVSVNGGKVSVSLPTKTYEISLETVVGVSLVDPSKIEAVKYNPLGVCCGSTDELQLLPDALTTVGKHWMIFALDIQKNSRGDIKQVKLRKILFSSSLQDEAMAMVEKIRDELGYFDPSIRGFQIQANNEC